MNTNYRYIQGQIQPEQDKDPQQTKQELQKLKDVKEATKNQPNFLTLVLIFLIGALSFAVALSYNNFAQALIKKYSINGDSIGATLFNLVVFSIFSLGILYLAWKSNPQAVGTALV